MRDAAGGYSLLVAMPAQTVCMRRRRVRASKRNAKPRARVVTCGLAMACGGVVVVSDNQEHIESWLPRACRVYSNASSFSGNDRLHDGLKAGGLELRRRVAA